MSKNPWKSKVNWLGALQLISGFSLLVIDNDLVKEYPKVVSVFIMVNGLATLLIRAVTTLPIGWNEEPPVKGPQNDSSGGTSGQK